MKRTALRSKRLTPRRNEGRVVQERLHPKASAPPTPEQRAYHRWVRARGQCEGCGGIGVCHVHHLLSDAPGKVGRRDHFFVLSLCSGCHTNNTHSVHGLGSEAAFLAMFRIDLVAIAVARLKGWRDERGSP